MAYSRSPVTILRRRVHLEPLFRGETTRWTSPFPDNVDAGTWAYKVRECLYVAGMNRSRFPELARHADAYKVEVLDQKTVQASLSQSSTSTESRVETVSSEQRRAPITFGEATTRFEIVQALLNDGAATSGPFHFPNAALNPAELAKLSTWAAAQEPVLTVIQPKGTNAITLVKTLEES